MKQIIPIFMAIDDNYARFASCTIISLINHKSNDRIYNINIIYTFLNDDNKKKLLSLKEEGININIMPMDNDLEVVNRYNSSKKKKEYFSDLSIYVRLFISEMFPNIDKGIYIDSDIILNEDIAKLYDIDLKGKMVGACHETSTYDIKVIDDYVENVLGIKREQYINSGVLLMDLALMREKRFSEKFLELFNKYHFEVIAPDQDYLNVICHNEILYIDDKWNMPPNNDVLKEPYLIHYNLMKKPWCYDNVKFEEYFWDTAKKSPFYEEIVDYKNHYTGEMKEQREKLLDDLFKRARDIIGYDVTFKKVKEQGEQIEI